MRKHKETNDSSVRIERLLVTPDMALDWLELIDPELQRKYKPQVHARYARDMSSGHWTECAAPIVFYVSGELADGQHRLWAVATTKKAQWFTVMWGMSRQAGLNIDTGLTRSVADAVRISGELVNGNPRMVSVARGCEFGDVSPASHTASEKLGLIRKHEAAVEFACHNLTTQRFIGSSPVASAVARAWYHEADKERLASFCLVMKTGLPNGQRDIAAIALRNHLLRVGSLSSTTSHWRATFLRTQRAIRSFMRGRPMQKSQEIRNEDREDYPLIDTKKVELVRVELV